MTAAPISEADWQEQVTDLAAHYGWKWLHVRRSIGKGRTWTTATNVIGWPDLHLWNERQRRTMYVELKSASGVVSPAQEAVHGSLRAAGCEVYVWRPDDLDVAHAALKARPETTT